MSTDNKFERFNEDTDPPDSQCQGSVASGQCPYKKEPGLDYCPRCKGCLAGLEKKRQVRNYRLTVHKARVEEKADNPQIKSLREEIGILRITLESLINRCTDETELLLNSNKISDLVIKIEKLVSSCHRLEKSEGSLLDKTTIIKIATSIIEIIAEEINDEAALDRIGTRIMKEVITTTSVEDE